MTNCHQLKLPAADGKPYLTDVADAAKKGGNIAKKARVELEQKTGRKVVTGENFLPPQKAAKHIKEESDE